jgi:hypothetical protein
MKWSELRSVEEILKQLRALDKAQARQEYAAMRLEAQSQVSHNLARMT